MVFDGVLAMFINSSLPNYMNRTSLSIWY